MQTKTHSVVLIDDDPGTRDIFRIVLERQSIHVATFGAVDNALDYLSENNPDIIVIDLVLGATSGFAALEQVRKQHPHCCIFATTAYQMWGTIGELFTRGFDGFVPKPLDVNKLVDLLTCVHQ